MGNRIRLHNTALKLLPILLSAGVALMAQAPGQTTCSVKGFLRPMGTAITSVRAEPRTDAKVVAQLRPSKSEEEAEFEIIGAKDGWLLIRNAELFAAAGWIRGSEAAVQLADYTLKAAPRTDAHVVLRLQNRAKGWGPDSYGVRAIHGCTGEFAEVTAADPDGHTVRGWVGHTCANQLTTCDMGGIPPPPSFDCAAAHSAIERMICADPELSAFDNAMGNEFAAALTVVPRPVALRAEQREWLAQRRDKAGTAEVLRNLYTHREEELRNAAETARNLRELVFSGDLKQSCVPLRRESNEKCRVEETGAMGGGVSYQLQGYYDGELRVCGGAVILARAGSGGLRPLVWDTGDTTHYVKPRFIAAPVGRLLDLAASMEGTGNFSVGSLYRETGGRWQEIDVESWLGDLRKLLPKGLAINKGVYPDWAKMTADTPLWSETDGNCCPTGGSVHVILALRGDRVVIRDARVSRKPME
jgi:uncharacterized protein